MAPSTPWRLRVGLLPCPDDLDPAGAWCVDAAREIEGAALDLLITSEMPFGSWLARSDRFDAAAAAMSVAIHASGLDWLRGLSVPAIVTSRAIESNGRLANEALAIVDGAVRPLHRKRYLPQEADFYEGSWFVPGTAAPSTMQFADAAVGVLLCTEAMVPEDARRLGEQAADVIAIPRATGPAAMWATAVSMAAISAGAFAVSVNRDGAPAFSGGVIACDPDGAPIDLERVGDTLWLVDLDLSAAQASKATYPRYVFQQLNVGTAIP